MDLNEPAAPTLTPKKGFGQHFLIQESAIRGIVEAVLASPAPRLLEIGPGPGVLTAPLLRDGRELLAVELDPEAVAVLQVRFAEAPNLRLLHGDAVKVDLPGGAPFAVAGNLPYNASTAILTRFLLEPVAWERMVFMFQLEVASRILGRPGTKDFGPLSILCQLCCRMTRLLKLGPGAFRPAPKVDSAVVVFEPLPGAPPLEVRSRLLAFLFEAFGQRRKTLANNLQPRVASARTREALAALGLPPDARAEAIPPSAWCDLHRVLA